MSQTLLLQKMKRYLQQRYLERWQEDSLDIEQLSELEKLIFEMKEGFCRGFSVCYRAMRAADVYSKQENPTNLHFWQMKLAAIEGWNGDPESLLKPCLPLDKAGKDSAKLSLAAVFEEVISLVVYYQNNQTIRLDPIDPETDTPLIKERLELSISAPDSKTKSALSDAKKKSSDSELHLVQEHYKAIDDFTPEQLKILLSENGAERHYHYNLSFIGKPGHITCFWYDLKTSTWWFYDPNYDDNQAHKFDTVDALITEINARLGKKLVLRVVKLTPDLDKEVLSELDHPFPRYIEGVKEKINHRNLSPDIFLWISRVSPDSIPLILQQPDPAIHKEEKDDKRIVSNAPISLESIDLTLDAMQQRNALQYAAALVHDDAIRALLKNGANPNYQDRDGDTPLHLCLSSLPHSDAKRVAAIIALQQFGADIEIPNSSGKTPLHCAVLINNTPSVQVLLEAKVDVNCRDNNRDTPLHFAVANGNVEMVIKLLKNGANVNAKNKAGKTPLDLAKEYNQAEMRKKLIDAGAASVLVESAAVDKPKVKKQGSWSKSENKRLPIPDKLLKTVEQQIETIMHEQHLKKYIALPKDKNERLAAAALTAVKQGDLSAVQSLLKEGLDPNLKDKNGKTLLALATINNYPAVMAALVQHGANCDVALYLISDEIDNTTTLKQLITMGVNEVWLFLALYKSIAAGKIHVAEMLIPLLKSDDLFEINLVGENLLHLAIKNGREDIFCLLLEYGIDPTAENDAGHTPLDLAVWGGHIAVVKKILSSMKNAISLEKIKQLVFKAINKDDIHIVKLLLNYNRDIIGDIIARACHEKKPWAITTLISAGINLKQIFAIGGEELLTWLPAIKVLHGAAEVGDIATLKKLQEVKLVSLNQADQEGNTALSIAAQANQYNFVAELIRFGADINAANKNGQTILYLAASRGHLQTMQILIGAKANVTAVLDQALKEKNITVLLSLLSLKAISWKEINKKIAPAMKEWFMGAIQDGLMHGFAAANDCEAFDELLVSMKEQVMLSRNAEGLTPFMVAAKSGALEVVEYLQATGADILATSQNGNTALHWAVATGQTMVVAKLLENKADPMIRNQLGQLPLHLAANGGHSQIIKMLFAQKDGNPNDRDDDQQTPLHLAAANGHVTVVRQLISGGADLHAINCYGLTPWDYAAEKRHVAVLRAWLRVASMENVYRLFQAAIARNSLDSIAQGFSQAGLDYVALRATALKKNDSIFIQSLINAGVIPAKVITRESETETLPSILSSVSNSCRFFQGRADGIQRLPVLPLPLSEAQHKQAVTEFSF